MTTLSAHQPAYLPWLGYFDKIMKSDIFIYLDNVQFEKNSFINRNAINSFNGPLTLTVPVLQKGHIESNITKLKINNLVNWRKKHWNAIMQNYSKANFFGCYGEKIHSFYTVDWEYLSDLCFEMLLFFMKELDLKTKILKLSSLHVEGHKQKMIIELCQLYKANHFIFGSLGKNYVDEGEFKKLNISVSYQNYINPIYDQYHGHFVSNLSILDALLNIGPDKLRGLLVKGF